MDKFLFSVLVFLKYLEEYLKKKIRFLHIFEDLKQENYYYPPFEVEKSLDSALL